MTQKNDVKKNNFKNVQMVCDLLKNISNEVRYKICMCLKEDCLTVTELNKKIPVSQSSLSQHLKMLRLSGLVVGSKRGSRVEYTLTSTMIRSILDAIDRNMADKNYVGIGYNALQKKRETAWLNDGEEEGIK